MPSDIMSTTDTDDNDNDNAPDDDNVTDEDAADPIVPRAGPALKKCCKNPSVILFDKNERLVGKWLEQETEFINSKYVALTFIHRRTWG